MKLIKESSMMTNYIFKLKYNKINNKDNKICLLFNKRSLVSILRFFESIYLSKTNQNKFHHKLMPTFLD